MVYPNQNAFGARNRKAARDKGIDVDNPDVRTDGFFVYMKHPIDRRVAMKIPKGENEHLFTESEMVGIKTIAELENLGWRVLGDIGDT